MNNKLTYEELLKEKSSFIIPITGTSMLPLLDSALDTVEIIKINKDLKKGDVILYKRYDNTYILHRIIKIKKHYYLLSGDNQYLTEKVKKSQIIGIMNGYFKNETYISVNDKEYLKYSKHIMHTRIFRKIRHHISKIYHKIFKKDR